MRKDLKLKALIYPLPVLIVGTYDEDGTPNAMNAAWGGITEENDITVCVSADHKTTENFTARGAFTVSMATADFVAQCDYVGIESGNKVEDKLERCGLHTMKSELVDAPIILELPMALECRVKSYDPESCRLVGEIVNVSCDESVLTDGKIDPGKLRPITYDSANHTYRVIGEVVGKAFSDGLRFKK
jgi:flavin reductase (DIM6/NTAB) family NADH-FMN oxidoreductase RutF